MAAVDRCGGAADAASTRSMWGSCSSGAHKAVARRRPDERPAVAPRRIGEQPCRGRRTRRPRRPVASARRRSRPRSRARRRQRWSRPAGRHTSPRPATGRTALVPGWVGSRCPRPQSPRARRRGCPAAARARRGPPPRCAGEATPCRRFRCRAARRPPASSSNRSGSLQAGAGIDQHPVALPGLGARRHGNHRSIVVDAEPVPERASRAAFARRRRRHRAIDHLRRHAWQPTGDA